MTDARDAHERLTATVVGRVQGVGFRHFVTSHARQMLVAGRVRNEPDGSVTLEAEGSRPALERLLGLIREGPSAARVDGVEAEWGEATGAHDAFRAER